MQSTSQELCRKLRDKALPSGWGLCGDLVSVQRIWSSDVLIEGGDQVHGQVLRQISLDWRR